MNKTEIITTLTEKTGMTTEVCSAVVNALEEVSESVLLLRMKGIKLDKSDMVLEIAEKAGVPEEDCRAVLAAFEETFDEGLSDKFRLFK